MNDVELNDLCRKKNECVDRAQQFVREGKQRDAQTYFANAATLDVQIGDAFAAKNEFSEAVVNWTSAGNYYDIAQDPLRATEAYKKALAAATTYLGVAAQGLIAALRQHL